MGRWVAGADAEEPLLRGALEEGVPQRLLLQLVHEEEQVGDLSFARVEIRYSDSAHCKKWALFAPFE